MKLSDIILQLMASLPGQTSMFTDNLGVSSVSMSGTTVTVQTDADHGLQTGSIVTIEGVLVPAEIDSYAESATEVEFVTATEHDLTLHPTDPPKTVRITGTTFDETYRLKSVANRFRFTVYRDAVGPLPVGDKLYLQEQISDSFNGLKQVTSVPSTTTFTFESQESFADPNDLEGAVVSGHYRISGAVSLEVAQDSYTAQGSENDLWVFAVLGDVTASKDRATLNDSITQQGQQMDYFQQIVANLSVYLFIPNKGTMLTDTNGRAARDVAESVRPYLLRSLVGINFDTGLDAPGQGVLAYVADGFTDYNGAFYIHQYTFQQVIDITYGDTAIETADRAFRDIDLTLRNQFNDDAPYTATVNLDDDPA